MDIKLEGMEELEKTIQEMTLDTGELRKAVKKGIDTIAEGLQKDSPKRTGKLATIKTVVKSNGLGVEGIAGAGAFYSTFQEFGTSKQKAHVGYFENSVRENSNKAIKEIAEVVFEKIK